MAEEMKDARVATRTVDPNGVYAIRGSTLLSVMQTLDNEIPCRFVSTVDTIFRALLSAEPLGSPNPDTEENTATP